MSSYTVEWSDEAKDQLASIWLQSSDRRAVTTAEAGIDRLLKRDPLGSGRLLSEGLYRLDWPPLAAYFEMDESSHEVRVSDVVEVA
jgi:hypothetical protein